MMHQNGAWLRAIAACLVAVLLARLALDQLFPPNLIDLLIAAEDRRFCDDAGVDPLALARGVPLSGLGVGVRACTHLDMIRAMIDVAVKESRDALKAA